MPALRSLPDRFSVQGCERSEGAKVPSKRRKGAQGAGDAFGLPLFTSKRAGGVRVDARASVRRPSPAAGRLSIGHNDTKLPSSAAKPAKVPTFRIWRGASLGETPGIPNHGPSAGNVREVESKRGKILTFSESSRRNLQTSLAKVRNDIELWTCCLSGPGYSEHLTHKGMKHAFLRFMKRLTAKASRDSRFREVAGFWKQELQKRNVLHFHLTFAGIAPNDVAIVRHWVMEQWVECVMMIPGMPQEIARDEEFKMLMVHGHESNFERVRGNFHAYFAKYLGKDVEAHAAENPIPGRWWGKFNSSRIPMGRLQELALPSRVAVHNHRQMRRIRQARADNARHRGICRKYDFLVDGQPAVSRAALLRCYNTLQSFGGLDALDAWDAGVCPAVRKLIVNGDAAPFRMLLAIMNSGDRVESVLGGFKFPAAMKFAPVRLTGAHVPEMMVRLLQYAGQRALDDRERFPF